MKLLLKGSISSAVSALHSGLEFAGEGASVEEMAEEARDAGASLEAEQDGMVSIVDGKGGRGVSSARAAHPTPPHASPPRCA